MNKIICDICGTTYPDTAECCPICGCTNDAAADLLGSDVIQEDFVEETNVRTADFSENTRKKEIFDYDEVNSDYVPEEEDEEEEYDEEEEEEEDEEEAPRHNTFVVILLTVLIVALLAAAGFIYVRYFLPNKDVEETVPTTAAVVEAEVTETTQPTIPCDQMAMSSAGIAELSAEGQQFLLHVKAFPENTTDKIIYTSGDESIATVTEDGKITAISEGETVIYISCGKTSMECPVIVKYVEETVPPTTEAVEETVPAETEAVEETVPAETEAEAEETSAETKPAVNSNVKLKLKKTDIQLGVYYQFQLELDCELSAEDVTWTSEHPHIATVDEQGNVTAVKSGTTAITAKYGDQEVQCIVRCIWY